MIQDRHVGIPLDIVDLRILCHEVIDDREDKILNLRIRHVEYELSTSSALYGITLRSLDNPFRMLLIKL